MPSGYGATREQKEFIKNNKDDMHIGQMSYLLGLSKQTIKKYVRIT